MSMTGENMEERIEYHHSLQLLCNKQSGELVEKSGLCGSLSL